MSLIRTVHGLLFCSNVDAPLGLRCLTEAINFFILMSTPFSTKTVYGPTPMKTSPIRGVAVPRFVGSHRCKRPPDAGLYRCVIIRVPSHADT